MKDILNINWNEYITNAKNISKVPWKPKLPENFLPHLMPLLASIPLVKDEYGNIKSTETFANMPIELDTPNGLFPSAVLKRIIGFLYYMPRSSLLTAPQGKDPTYGSMTPLVMYAQKRDNGVPYEKWDRKDPQFIYFLGRYLLPLLAIRNDFTTIIPVLDDNDIVKARAAALTYKGGPKIGNVDSLTSYKCNITQLMVPKYAEEQQDDESSDDPYGNELYYNVPLDKIIIRMLLQTWICNASIRRPGVMILDPRNWDATPPAIDAMGIDVIFGLVPKDEVVIPWT